MDDIPDRTHVTLWIREYEAYLVAEEDSQGVACQLGEVADWTLTHGALHGAWALHRLVRGGNDYVLFHSAIYGGYLAINEDEVDHDQYAAVQCTYDSPEQVNVLFQARGAGDGSGDIFLSNRNIGGDLGHQDVDTRLHWVVQAIPPRQLPPELPNPPQPILPPEVPIGGPIRHRLRGGRGGHVVDAVQPQAVLRRRINYVQADDRANFNNPLQWRVLEQFEGQSVFNLRRALAAELGEADNDLGITLCVSGGSNGRWTPLVVDLPSGENAMNIVILTTGSPAAQELVYPDVDEL